MGPTRRRLDDRRWHFQHGPIDLVLAADGTPHATAAAVEAGWARFDTVLDELVAELPLLRRHVGHVARVQGTVAQRMVDACRPHGGVFVTPMAAVAGAVADEVLAAMVDAAPLARAFVNDGGDIALHLGPGERYRVGLIADPGRILLQGDALAPQGHFHLDAALPVRGVATSGWRGRSHSLGIADSVTILAATAAAADAAATMVANAVDVDHPAIRRARACDVDDNTDLGHRLVTRDVGPLPDAAIAAALARGEALATTLHRAGLLWGAVLQLQGRARFVGGVAPAQIAA